MVGVLTLTSPMVCHISNVSLIVDGDSFLVLMVLGGIVTLAMASVSQTSIPLASISLAPLVECGLGCCHFGSGQAEGQHGVHSCQDLPLLLLGV